MIRGYLLICLVMAGGRVMAGVDSLGGAAAVPDSIQAAPTVYGPGEKLVFDITYGPISAGEATLEVVKVIDFYGRPCYRIESRANSNRFFSSIYKVRDRVISYMDAEGLFSRYFYKRLQEGNFRKTVEIIFDADSDTAHYAEGKELPIVGQIQDVLSAFFYVRNLNLEPGSIYEVPAHTSGKTYTLNILVHGRKEVKTEAGKFSCLVVEPVIQGEGLFKHEGKLTIYLSDDSHRLPVMIKTKVPVGSIDVELKSYQLGVPLHPLILEGKREGD